MVYTCNSKCDIDASKKTRKFVIRDLNFSGTDRLAVPGFMVHTCISKCNRDGSKNNKIQNVVEMQARKEDQLRISAVLTSSHTGLHKLWYPSIRGTSTWSKFPAHGEHGDVFLFSNLGAL